MTKSHSTKRPSAPRGTTVDRLVGLTNIDTHRCVEWPYYRNVQGYGSINYKGKTRGTHQVSCEMHHGPKPTTQHQVAHSCGNPPCINPRHLRWATPRENSADMVVHGTRLYGERASVHKLNDAQVAEIRARHKDGESQRSIAKDFRLSPTSINKVVRAMTWGHLTDTDQPTPRPDGVLTATEAAEVLGMRYQTVCGLISNGFIKASGPWVATAEVERYAEERRQRLAS